MPTEIEHATFDGFLLAVKLLGNLLGAEPKPAEWITRICQVADGSRPLIDSVGDAFTQFQQNLGRPATPQEKQAFYAEVSALTPDAAKQDQELAERVCRVLEHDGVLKR